METSITSLQTRAVMNGKPVITTDAKSIISLKSSFEHKLLCDGPVFSAGTACAYSCSFCYVSSVMRFNPDHLEKGTDRTGLVVRRANSVEIVRRQLLNKKGQPKYQKPEEVGRVIYASPLVDVAANMELVRETIEICRVILELTPWTIRLLSKSNLLPKIAEAFSDPATKHRLIYGVSTGTLDDGLAKAFEQGAPLVSKRIASLHWLQDHGFRTYGMICPSLPLASPEAYQQFAHDCAERLRADRLEHVWAEVINVRGQAFKRTETALSEADFNLEADRLRAVSQGRGAEEAWETYARATFEAHARVYANCPGKLRFLQYAKGNSRPWWAEQQDRGAVLLGE